MAIWRLLLRPCLALTLFGANVGGLAKVCLENPLESLSGASAAEGAVEQRKNKPQVGSSLTLSVLILVVA